MRPQNGLLYGTDHCNNNNDLCVTVIMNDQRSKELEKKSKQKTISPYITPHQVLRKVGSNVVVFLINV